MTIGYQLIMRFLANARNDIVLGDTGESRGDSLSESPLLSLIQQLRHVIPSASEESPSTFSIF
jgi:hypothetical protein